jgi:mannose-6-phosphate isomerase-like protein (cupin superfamily)
MAISLEGGVLVTGLEEGQPLREGNLRIWRHFTGQHISMRVLELDGRAALRSDDGDQVLYILERDTGIHLPPGAQVELEGKITLIGVGTLEPAQSGGVATALQIRLADQPIERTGDRWYRELIQSEITQFVGSIPPGRAPDHFHLYEEVLCILQGSGFLWAGASKTPIAPGSCVYLPKGQPHCVENTTSGELRLLGVFYPAGSPAMRYPVHERADRSPEEDQLERGD